MSTLPLVSICIPSYNSAEFIEETIQSVTQQSYSNIELIITDDGSIDDTVKRIEKVIANCQIPLNFQKSKKNTGIEANWNHCLSLAKGKYIKLLPADDTLSPNCVTEQVKQFEMHDDIVLVFCARKIVTRSGKALLNARFYNNQKVSNKSLLKRCILSGTNVIGEPGAVLFRHDIAQRIGAFNGNKPYVIDLDYWVRLLSHGHAIALSDTLCTFRIDNNLSVRLGVRRLLNYFSIIDDISTRWEMNKIVIILGKFRTLLNEFLRRGVHIMYRFVG